MGKLFSAVYDVVMAPLEKAGIERIRRNLLRDIEGYVLEIGFGTGANFPFYQKASYVEAIEPNPDMIERSAEKVRRATVPIQTYTAKAEKLPFPDQSFDAITGTLVFCTIPDPVKALQEMKRVSRPGATFHFFEHVKLEHEKAGKVQDVLTPAWKVVCDGCHLNRPTIQLFEEAGLQVNNVKRFGKGMFVVFEGNVHGE
ncbi:type 11 methyltransferase [Jeotgalibacillus alimentarius]|uniref:Type 11 methyltransferase n=1 Tax=Jeotgalibacillus alimentarius TaxID=135826 RepID=A0A0C2RMI9_9BACL|nr:class I SAM-dependent methyltransferase [Jeotgalibacillus alimentarius]KIL51460.1 type 11 methyltransferase [Jeotgalibacillus alimentarius]